MEIPGGCDDIIGKEFASVSRDLMKYLLTFLCYHCMLYTYRLGHGDLIEEEGRSVPFRVEILHMHRSAASLLSKSQ